MRIRSEVTRVPAAQAQEAVAHFSEKMRFETDCWDVHYTLEHGSQDFVLLDVRSPDLFARGHLPQAINLPQRKVTEKSLAAWSPESLFVVYCAGPHCNGADKAALRLAALGEGGQADDRWSRGLEGRRLRPCGRAGALR